ncbi:MAG: glycosyl transferase [Phycisphaerae bacterium]|nr:glycosyl transferase [Phycisphaerae bacterium]
MMFLTVGTLFSFDRLVQAIDQGIADGTIREEIIAQIGEGGYQPRNMEFVAFLEKAAFDEKVKQSSGLISHAGMGSIEMSFQYRKPLLVMPRKKKYREHVNDHQVDTAEKFEQLGHILVAYESDDLPMKLNELKSFIPKPRINQISEVVRYLSEYIQSLK